MIENKRWYAVYTRPRGEKKVSEILSRKKVENFCPINKVIRQWSDRKKVVQEPLFPSVVFVRVTEQEINLLKRINGVISIIHWLGKPAVIRDSEIEIIKRFLGDHVNIRLEKTRISVNDTIRVVAGPLMELEGHVLAITNRIAKVILPSLGYLLLAEVETANVDVLEHRIPAPIALHYPLYAAR